MPYGTITVIYYSELNHFREAVSERMKQMRENGTTQLRATIAEQAQILGVELKDLIPRKTRRLRRQDDVE
jgi:hypothetical protein